MKVFKIKLDKGVLVLNERTEDVLKERVNSGWGGEPNDVIIDPEVNIKDGILTLKGQRHYHERLNKRDKHYHSIPYPVSDLNENWRDIIYIDEDKDLYKKDVKTGVWLFGTRKIEKDVEHINSGYYLKKKGYEENITTSNFRIYNLKDKK